MVPSGLQPDELARRRSPRRSVMTRELRAEGDRLRPVRSEKVVEMARAWPASSCLGGRDGGPPDEERSCRWWSTASGDHGRRWRRSAMAHPVDGRRVSSEPVADAPDRGERQVAHRASCAAGGRGRRRCARRRTSRRPTPRRAAAGGTGPGRGWRPGRRAGRTRGWRAGPRRRPGRTSRRPVSTSMGPRPTTDGLVAGADAVRSAGGWRAPGPPAPGRRTAW